MNKNTHTLRAHLGHRRRDADLLLEVRAERVGEVAAAAGRGRGVGQPRLPDLARGKGLESDC
jgi:hypothetical protein